MEGKKKEKKQCFVCVLQVTLWSWILIIRIKNDIFFKASQNRWRHNFICFVTLLSESRLSGSIDKENIFSTRMSRICVLKRRRKYTNSCKNAKRHSKEKPVRARAAVLFKRAGSARFKCVADGWWWWLLLGCWRLGIGTKAFTSPFTRWLI